MNLLMLQGSRIRACDLKFTGIYTYVGD